MRAAASGTRLGEAGRQVWQGVWDEANIPTLAALSCPSVELEEARRPGQVDAHVPRSLALSCQGVCVMGEAGTGFPPKPTWVLRMLPMGPPVKGNREPHQLTHLLPSSLCCSMCTCGPAPTFPSLTHALLPRKTERGEVRFVSTWTEKWRLSFSFEFLAKICNSC